MILERGHAPSTSFSTYASYVKKTQSHPGVAAQLDSIDQDIRAYNSALDRHAVNLPAEAFGANGHIGSGAYHPDHPGHPQHPDHATWAAGGAQGRAVMAPWRNRLRALGRLGVIAVTVYVVADGTGRVLGSETGGGVNLGQAGPGGFGNDPRQFS